MNENSYILLIRAEQRERMSRMDGKTGFGSREFYGRESSEDLMGGQRRSSVEQIINNVQDGASVFATKFVGQAQEDFDSIKKLVTAGGSKLGDILQDLQVTLFKIRIDTNRNCYIQTATL